MLSLVADEKKCKQLKDYIDEMKGHPGPLMPIMQKAQDIFGALSMDVQEFIAENMGIPLSDVYGVATFYSQFALSPKKKYVISVCMGTACYVKNSKNILSKLENILGAEAGAASNNPLFTLEATRCLGCCGLAPVIMINDQVYGRLKPEQIPGILEQYKE